MVEPALQWTAVLCVVEPHESEAKYPTSVWRDFNLHLNEMDLLSQQ